MYTLPRSRYFSNRCETVALFREKKQKKMNDHQHEFCELMIILSGEGIHTYNGNKYDVDRGEVCFIGSDAYHGFQEADDLKLVNILLDPAVVDKAKHQLEVVPGYNTIFGSSPTSYPHVKLNAEHLVEVSNIIDDIDRDLSTNPSSLCSIAAEAHLMLLLCTVLRQYQLDDSIVKSFDRFDGLLNWIELHLDQPLAVPELAQKLGMSERNFYRRFRTAFGISPIQYIFKARLRKAHIMLSNPLNALTCDEVSLECGFNNYPHFSTCFLKEFGRSPSDFKRAQRKE